MILKKQKSSGGKRFHPNLLLPERFDLQVFQLEKVRNRSHTRFRTFLVEVTGLEPAASWSQTRRATNCATPRYMQCIALFLRAYHLAQYADTKHDIRSSESLHAILTCYYITFCLKCQELISFLSRHCVKREWCVNKNDIV